MIRASAPPSRAPGWRARTARIRPACAAGTSTTYERPSQSTRGAGGALPPVVHQRHRHDPEPRVPEVEQVAGRRRGTVRVLGRDRDGARVRGKVVRRATNHVVVAGGGARVTIHGASAPLGSAVSSTVRFSGSISPATDGARVDIQKLRSGVWTTIAHTRSKAAGGDTSHYKLRVKLYRSGQYRVVASPSRPELVAGAGRTVDITVRR